MGMEIAVLLAHHGFSVILIDLQDKLDQFHKSASAKIKQYKRMNGFQCDENAIFGQIALSDDLNSAASADIIFESINESLNEKERLFRELSEICVESCIFISNTSCIPITLLGQYTNRPGFTIGVHFLNPVMLQSIVEIIHTAQTDITVTNKVQNLLRSLGKTFITVKDSAGFVSNRLSHLLMNEAARLVQEGVASPKDIDALFRLGFGHKMGPLETADLIGIDTIVHSLDVLWELKHEEKYACCGLLRDMLSARKLGIKAGEGFYRYPGAQQT